MNKEQNTKESINIKKMRKEILGEVEDYLKETYISAIGETDYSIDDMIEHFRSYFKHEEGVYRYL